MNTHISFPIFRKGSRSEDVILNELDGHEGIIQFDGIEAIFRTGGCDLDTNRLERLNRYVSLSRRNSLFFGSHEGAKRGALFYSLSCSCRLCGVDFFEYLTDVINRIAAMGPKATADTCRDLLPDKWEKKQ